MNTGKKIMINVDETEYSTFSTPAFDKKVKWTYPDKRIINAIIPGTILDIFVKVGDKVNIGDKMLAIQAMKMNNQILFNQQGIVDKILVNKGDIVSKGHVLVVLK